MPSDREASDSQDSTESSRMMTSNQVEAEQPQGAVRPVGFKAGKSAPTHQGLVSPTETTLKKGGWLPQKWSYLFQNMASLTPVSPNEVTYDAPHV